MQSEHIPLQTILAAKKEDHEAVDKILKHYNVLIREYSKGIVQTVAILVNYKPFPDKESNDLIDNIMDFISARLLVAIVMKFDPMDISQE